MMAVLTGKEKVGREVNTSPGICQGGLTPRQVEPTQILGMRSQQLPPPPSVARLLRKRDGQCGQHIITQGRRNRAIDWSLLMSPSPSCSAASDARGCGWVPKSTSRFASPELEKSAVRARGCPMQTQAWVWAACGLAWPRWPGPRSP